MKSTANKGATPRSSPKKDFGKATKPFLEVFEQNQDKGHQLTKGCPQGPKVVPKTPSTFGKKSKKKEEVSYPCLYYQKKSFQLIYFTNFYSKQRPFLAKLSCQWLPNKAV